LTYDAKQLLVVSAIKSF